jgi:hypothetical protein
VVAPGARLGKANQRPAAPAGVWTSDLTNATYRLRVVLAVCQAMHYPSRHGRRLRLLSSAARASPASRTLDGIPIRASSKYSLNTGERSGPGSGPPREEPARSSESDAERSNDLLYDYPMHL